MPYAQFMAIPPLELVSAIFVWYTACCLEAGAHWSVFKEGIPPELHLIKSYIRPSHNKLLKDCEAGEVPLAFLRQILRPHGFCIKTVSHGWRVDTDTTSPVKIRKGTEIMWD